VKIRVLVGVKVGVGVSVNIEVEASVFVGESPITRTVSIVAVGASRKAWSVMMTIVVANSLQLPAPPLARA
jgi:hypothetical protein